MTPTESAVLAVLAAAALSALYLQLDVGLGGRALGKGGIAGSEIDRRRLTEARGQANVRVGAESIERGYSTSRGHCRPEGRC